jgi:hypothetical protein
MHFRLRPKPVSMLRELIILAFLFLSELSVSFVAKAEEFPSVEPTLSAEEFKQYCLSYSIHSLWFAPSLALLNSMLLMRASSEKQPSQIHAWVLGSQTVAFAGLGILAGQKLFISPSLIVSTGLLSGATGYLLAKQALDGNRVAAVASVAIPVAPIVTFSVIILTADYHF